jgi:hypothetical protein
MDNLGPVRSTIQPLPTSGETMTFVAATLLILAEDVPPPTIRKSPTAKSTAEVGLIVECKATSDAWLVLTRLSDEDDSVSKDWIPSNTAYIGDDPWVAWLGISRDATGSVSSEFRQRVVARMMRIALGPP